MAGGGIWGSALPIVVLAAALAGGSASAGEPLRLDPVTLDQVTGAGAKVVKARGIVAQAIFPGSSLSLAEVALKLAGQQQPVLTPPDRGTGVSGSTKRQVSKSGKKIFKADRVTKPHTERLVVHGSAGG